MEKVGWGWDLNVENRKCRGPCGTFKENREVTRVGE